jgi:hypothetical protein
MKEAVSGFFLKVFNYYCYNSNNMLMFILKVNINMSEISTSAQQEIMPEIITSNEQPEILLDHTVLYHGSATTGIHTLEIAENDTLGSGIYFVDNPTDAAGYATKRAKSSGEPIVYVAEIDHARLVNLDNSDILDEIMLGFGAILFEKINQGSLPWYAQAAAIKSLEVINQGVKPGRVRFATFNHTSLFTAYLEGLGYDGLKSWEGGEGQDVGPHESYVIFSPKKVRILPAS